MVCSFEGLVPGGRPSHIMAPRIRSYVSSVDDDAGGSGIGEGTSE
jgi:hypothetical protein